MSNAHKGSKLILQDQIIPVEFSSAHFDFNHDETGIMYGDLVEPSGSSVFTMRPFEGKFGGAIAVEGGTTNLWSGALAVYNNFATNGNMTATLVALNETHYNQQVYRLTMTPVSANALADIKTSLSAHGVMGSSLTYQSANTYMSSIYWRPVNKTDITVGGTASNISGWTDVGTVSGNNWNRSVAKWSGNANATDSKFWAFKCPSAVANEPIIIDWVCPQIEQKTFATSYVSGTRANGFLQYPKEVISAEEGCISFWIYGIGDTGNNPNPVFSSGTDGGFDFLITPSLDPFVRGYDSAGGSTQLRPAINLYNKWTHVVVSWKKSTFLGVYINGVLSVSSSSPVDWGAYYNKVGTGFYIGSGIRSNPFMMLSDLMISRKMPTDEDVVAWYTSGRQFYNPFDRRAFAL